MKYLQGQTLNVRQIENIGLQQIQQGNIKDLLISLNDLAYIDVANEDDLKITPESLKLYRLTQCGLQYMLYSIERLREIQSSLKNSVETQNERQQKMKYTLQKQQEEIETLKEKKRISNQTEKHLRNLVKALKLDENGRNLLKTPLSLIEDNDDYDYSDPEKKKILSHGLLPPNKYKTKGGNSKKDKHSDDIITLEDEKTKGKYKTTPNALDSLSPIEPKKNRNYFGLKEDLPSERDSKWSNNRYDKASDRADQAKAANIPTKNKNPLNKYNKEMIGELLDNPKKPSKKDQKLSKSNDLMDQLMLDFQKLDDQEKNKVRKYIIQHSLTSKDNSNKQNDLTKPDDLLTNSNLFTPTGTKTLEESNSFKLSHGYNKDNKKDKKHNNKDMKFKYIGLEDFDEEGEGEGESNHTENDLELSESVFPRNN